MHLFQNGNHPLEDVGDRGFTSQSRQRRCGYNVRCENPSFAAGIDRRISHERPFELLHDVFIRVAPILYRDGPTAS
jgi:hypothetical protein